MYDRLPTLELWERTAARREAGQDIVPMQGVPTLSMPEHVVKAVSESAGIGGRPHVSVCVRPDVSVSGRFMMPVPPLV